MNKLTPFDGDFDPLKSEEYEHLMTALDIHIEEDEELVISPVLKYEGHEFVSVDYSKLKIQLNFPQYYSDEDTGETFIHDWISDKSEISIPPGWTVGQIEELFPDACVVYFRLHLEVDCEF